MQPMLYDEDSAEYKPEGNLREEARKRKANSLIGFRVSPAERGYCQDFAKEFFKHALISQPTVSSLCRTGIIKFLREGLAHIEKNM